MGLTIGQIIGGHYKVAERLGAGGFGETYLAIDMHLPDLPTRVVKRLRTGHPDPGVMFLANRLFDTEAQVLYKLGTHERIPQLFAHFAEDDDFYLVQEFVDGYNLSEELTVGKPLSEQQAFGIATGILEVLVFVHQNQVIHRDLKPENIIRRKSDRKIVLIDFGIVKRITNQTTGATNSGNLTVGVGTFGYMPSEQANGEPKLSSDIYAVGVLTIQALTGMLPQQLPKDENLEFVWRDRVNINPEFADVIDQMVRYDFRKRYPSAVEALAALNGIADLRNQGYSISLTAPTLPVPPPLPPDPALSVHAAPTIVSNGSPQKFLSKASQWPKLSKSQMWLGTGAIALLATLGIAATWKFMQPPLQTPSAPAAVSANMPATGVDNFSTQVLPNFRYELTKTLVGHKDYVHAVSLSPDRRLLASGGADRTIRIWDMSTYKTVRILAGHSDRVYDLSFSPNGKTLVSAGADKTLRLWDVATGKPIKVFTGHNDRIYTVIFSPNGKLLASSSSDRTIKLWNVETGKLIKTLRRQGDRVNDMAFSPDGQTLVSGSGDGIIKFWDVETGQTMKTLSSNSGGILSLVYSPDGKTIATGIEDNTIRLWDLQNGKVLENVLKGHTKDVHTLAFSPDGKLLASGSADSTVRVWNLDLKQVQVLTGHSNGVSYVIFSNDNKLLISGSFDRTVKIWQRQ